MYTVISATPSPYARKVRIALLEKDIPFKLQTEVPWDSTTKTPDHNPLEKLPVLIPDDGRPAVYESHHIMEWIELKHPDPPLMPSGVDDRLFAKQVEVIADGVCDALVLAFFENQRDKDKQSKPWSDRQMRKVDGGIKALATWVENAEGDYLIGNKFGHADIATGSVLGFLNTRWPDHGWKQQHPGLVKYWQKLEERQSFKETVPKAQTFKDQIV
ncbi:glutathione S-transferase domain-containing protein [Myriangium duriaei CBS 260.36]|uniref:Glutathione S-transferase domain-containing protein n=1 Tax=Myriangium duriaei CBS 260.36 TaxID=1168546 RepID=A0A9P4MGE3_9PEZI|nr:glutathione S-transferase domain-containing protein [Myriangium duriaei CBS 260.36]